MRETTPHEPIEEALALAQSDLTIERVNTLLRSEQEFQKFLKAHPKTAYQKLVFAVASYRCRERRALRLWRRIVHHRRQLNRVLKRDVGIAVAALDYLTNIHQIMDEPRIMDEQFTESLAEEATRDGLTGLLLRKVFDVVLDKELGLAKRQKLPTTLLMMDLDDFKEVNDTHGHPMGDRVLEEISDTLLRSIRHMDTGARYGGEEFVVIMPSTNEESGTKVARRILAAVRELDIEGLSVTISIGLATSPLSTHSPQALLKAADEALYRAKSRGKDQLQATTLPSQ